MSENKKYQYSVFLNGSRDEQLVIRTDTFDELLEAKKNIDRIITKREGESKPIANTKSIPVEQFQETCERCGAKKILSKKGNMVCSEFCWTKK